MFFRNLRTPSSVQNFTYIRRTAARDLRKRGKRLNGSKRLTVIFPDPWLVALAGKTSSLKKCALPNWIVTDPSALLCQCGGSRVRAECGQLRILFGLPRPTPPSLLMEERAPASKFLSTSTFSMFETLRTRMFKRDIAFRHHQALPVVYILLPPDISLILD